MWSPIFYSLFFSEIVFFCVVVDASNIKVHLARRSVDTAVGDLRTIHHSLNGLSLDDSSHEISNDASEDKSISEYNLPLFKSDDTPSDVSSSNDASENEIPTDEEYEYEDGDIRRDLVEHENWHLLDNKGHCGRRSQLTNPKTMGGQNADLAEYPWMAHLRYSYVFGLFEFGGCGGSVISSRYVLTAAHCQKLGHASLYKVRLGEYDLKSKRDCFRGHCAPHPLDFEIEEIIIHDDYNKDMLLNDISLLRLNGEITFNDYIKPICLPTSVAMMDRNFVGTTLTVAGWGKLQEEPEARSPEILQEVRLRVVPVDGCITEENPFEPDTIICAGGTQGIDSCSGDSGGPLMYADPKGSKRHYLVGIVSSGFACNPEEETPDPGTYVKVSTFMPWILDMMYEY